MAFLSPILPSVDRPPRGLLAAGLLVLLAADVLLLARLDAAPKILLLLGGGAAMLWLLLRLPWAVALLAVGFPLLEPITIALGSDRFVFYLMRLTLIAALGLFLFARVRQPGRFLAGLCTDRVVLLAVLFGLVLAFGAIWTASPLYARLKLITYATTNVLLLVGGYALARTYAGEDAEARERRFDQLLAALAVFALLLALAGLLNLRIGYYPVGTRLSVLGINPIWVARITALGLFSLILLLKVGKIGLLPAGLGAAPITVVLLLAGSRAPLIGCALILVLWGYAQVGRSFARRFRWTFAALAGIGVALLVMPEAIRERFLQPFGGDPSGLARLGLVRIARGAFAEVPPLGIGTGGFSHLLRMGDIRAYPHNLFAEVTIENGIPGLLSLLGLLGLAFARGWAGRSDPRTLFALLAFLFALWNAQFSGDLIANEWIWLFAGVLAGRHR